jgi:TP901 family phage tail tape measure protein
MSSLLGEARVRIRPDLSGFMRETQSGVESAGRNAGSAFSKAMKVGAVALAGVTVAAGLAAKSTLDIGINYQNSLNTLQAVSGATVAQMSAVSATAKKLGADTSLTATSAADAATAMTELAKGGLSVDAAMTAAKGTLQLAAAAGVDAAEAASIQSSALNAYGLAAGDAGRVADVLANAANAASGEITDFAWALQAGGAVAHATGISLEDTAAALGLLANNGIKGSDAGTLLKSALLALQSPSDPARKAMENLGVAAYDASGNFVGLSSIFGNCRRRKRR